VLSDREREILHEMQRRLVTEDPDFARSFQEAGRRGDSHFSLQRAYETPRWAYTAALVVSVAFSVLMLVALAPWTALLFMTLAVMTAMARYHRDDEARQASSPRSGVRSRQAWPDHRR
jgi:Protein of unknown function (DUF3040)